MKDLQPDSTIRRWFIVGTIIQLLAGSLVADQFLPVLETKTVTYSNVTVTLKTARDVHIRHDGGLGNIDLDDLDDATKAELGYEIEPLEANLADGDNGSWSAEWTKILERARREPGDQVPFEIPAVLSPTLIAALLLIGLLCHLSFSYCSRLICLKAGSEAGFMIWVPLLQFFPMLRAAGMSGWWFLALFVPVLNLVVQVLWCIKIVNARGKHAIWAILLVLPIANIAAFLYLAFSNDGTSGGTTVDMGTFSPRPI